jgi:hypothetical protein
MDLMQLEWIKKDLTRISYAFSKVLEFLLHLKINFELIYPYLEVYGLQLQFVRIPGSNLQIPGPMRKTPYTCVDGGVLPSFLRVSYAKTPQRRGMG